MENKSESNSVIERAIALFDAVGISHLPDGDHLLILGLESTPERNLDEFGHLNNKFQMYGFRKHAGARLNSLLAFIRGIGFSAELIGRYGYPLQGEVNLKQEAIRTGIGKRGKNTLVLHPLFGPRLRFMALKTDISLKPVPPAFSDEVASVCRDCKICVDACPAGVLHPYCLNDPSTCLSNITPLAPDGRSILCDKCVDLCPAGHKKLG